MSRHRCRHHRRPAYMLSEILSALPLMAVTSALLTAGVITTLTTQRRSAEIVSSHDTVVALLDALRRDTRAATAAHALATRDGTWSFDLRTSDTTIRYTFAGNEATREVLGPITGHDARREWRIKRAKIVAEFDGGPLATNTQHSATHDRPAFSLLTLHIQWPGQSNKQVDPARRLSAAFSMGRGYRE